MDLLSVSGAFAIAAMLVQMLKGPPREPVAGACRRLEAHLAHHLAGQLPAAEEAADAVCAHLADTSPRRPLVLSVHGPPGVGKSLFHLLMAQALYNLTEGAHECPGYHCPPYKVVFGMDYTAGEAEQQHDLLRRSLLDHFHSFREALVVIEEFDKTSCDSKNLLRHLLEHGDANSTISLAKSVVILESNTGYLELYSLMQRAGGREKVSHEEASRVLKDRMFTESMSMGCFTHVECNRFVNLVDIFLPFYPLEQPHVQQVADLQLRDMAQQLRAAGRIGALDWDRGVTDFISGKVFYEDGLAVEGASGVHMLVSRYVTKALRQWDGTVFDRSVIKPPRRERLQLSVRPDGAGLRARVGVP